KCKTSPAAAPIARSTSSRLRVSSKNFSSPDRRYDHAIYACSNRFLNWMGNPLQAVHGCTATVPLGFLRNLKGKHNEPWMVKLRRGSGREHSHSHVRNMSRTRNKDFWNGK